MGTDEYNEPEQFDRTGGLDALTEKEARYILRNSTLAGIEDRIFKAAEAEGISPERWGYKTRDEIKRLQLKPAT